MTEQKKQKEKAPEYPPRIAAILKKYELDGAWALWEVRNGVYALLHPACELIQSREGIVFSAPEIIHDGMNEKEQITIRLTGTLGHRSEWSFGEASPKNNKNAYPWAMAEKRAKDRVILKLIDANGELIDEASGQEIDDNRLTKAKARDVFSSLQEEIKAADSVAALEILYLAKKAEVQSLPRDWEDDILETFAIRKRDINLEAGQ